MRGNREIVLDNDKAVRDHYLKEARRKVSEAQTALHNGKIKGDALEAVTFALNTLRVVLGEFTPEDKQD